MSGNHQKIADSFIQLLEVLRKLRAPGGCPWDRKQTSQSLVPYLLEETYEIIEAIEEGDIDALKEELGDLSLHILFQAELAREAGQFDISDSLRHISEKLIQDISIYPVNNQYDQADMQSEFIMTYGDGIYSNLNIQPMGVFLQEHQGVVISDALLHLKVDTTHQHYYVHPNGIKIILNRLNQHFDGTGDPDMMPLQSLVVKDELDVDFSLKNEKQFV